ncbi:MAG: sugar transferase [Candidatus Thorarchaeota archaeon]
MFRKIDSSTRRIFDILGAIIGLILVSALFLILPILIKLDSKGPVFYTQIRIGKNRRKKNTFRISNITSNENKDANRRKIASFGKPFKIYKFRTMKEGAEKKCGPVLASNNDPRITPLGRILRYTHLDELPQLINILKGDMSFVGPKPERPFFINHWANHIPEFQERFRTKPGLTGLAQIKTDHNYSHETIKKKLEYDLEYCNRENVKSYTKIMVCTFFKPLFKKTL